MTLFITCPFTDMLIANRKMQVPQSFQKRSSKRKFKKTGEKQIQDKFDLSSRKTNNL